MGKAPFWRAWTIATIIRMAFGVDDVNLSDSALKHDLLKPRTSFCKCGFGYSGVLLWNSVTLYLRKLDYLRRFKREVDHVYNNLDSLGRFEREIDQVYNNCQSGFHSATL